ncbi:3-isopropylmalate dehydratase small subunit [Bacillota bacterium]
MSEKIIGRVHKVGNNINTDLISPAKYMEKSLDEMAKHVLEGVDPNFYSKIQKGDIIVAGQNFGSGSSRETAPLALKGAGISLVIANFFARIFYRNCINIGLPIITLDDTSMIRDGDQLEVDVASGTIKNITQDEVYKTQHLPPHIIKLIEAGGLLNYIEKGMK